MYLSRLVPNLRHKQVRTDVANPYEMHRTLDKAVSEALAAGEERLLWRLDVRRDGNLRHLLVQTLTEPDWSVLEDGYLQTEAESKAVDVDRLASGRMHFRLRANPTVKRDGKRHALKAQEERRAWLERKAEHGGFHVCTVLLSGEERVRARKHENLLTLVAVTFDGSLEVREPEAFARTLESGIGSGKGFGMGMLSVAPV